MARLNLYYPDGDPLREDLERIAKELKLVDPKKGAPSAAAAVRWLRDEYKKQKAKEEPRK